MNFSYDTIATLLDVSLDKALAYKKVVLATVAGIAIAVAGSIAFNWYSQASQEAAQKDFFELLSYYDASGDHKWATVEQEYGKAYDRNKRAGIGPMFRVYQADALAAQGKQDEAIKLLDEVIRSIGSREIQDFMKLKLALMKLDSKQPGVQKDGLIALKAIAENSNHIANEAGLYYLGYFFFSQNDMTQAKNYWQQLMVKYGMKDQRQQSGLAEQTRGKLKLISADW